MGSSSTLTTTEAAKVASVAPSTIKRWSDQGLLPFSRTPGGHRRFERNAVERMLRSQIASSGGDDALATQWVRCLVEGRRHEIDGGLLEARARLGSWSCVADEVAAALAELGAQWATDRVTIAQEHVASDALNRALTRIGDTLPSRLDGPRGLLASVGEDEHTLGLSLAELCLREHGWSPLWLGRRTPLPEVLRLVEESRVAKVVLSASSIVNDEPFLRATAEQVGTACREREISLVLGGGGAWPNPPPYGTRLHSFAAFGDYLAEHSKRGAGR